MAGKKSNAGGLDAREDAAGPEASPKAVELQEIKNSANEKFEKVRSLLPIVAVLLVVGVILWLASFWLSSMAQSTECSSVLLQGWRDSCYSSLAKNTGNLSYCDFIPDAVKRDNCISNAGEGSPQTEASCAKMASVSLRDNCYKQVAVSAENPSYCELVTSLITKEQCVGQVAMAAGDPAMCARIANEEARYGCNNAVYQQVALQDGNPDLCQNMLYFDAASKQFIADNCVLALATNRSDSSLCNRIVNATLRERCSGVTVVGNCESISDPNQQNVCYYSAAMASKNPSDCGRVPGESMRNNCYYQLATQTRNASLCEFITNANLKALCRTGSSGG